MLSVSRCTLRSRAATNSLRNAVVSRWRRSAILASSSRARAAAFRRQDQHADSAEHTRGKNAADVGRGGGRDDGDERAEAERTRADCRRRRDGSAGAVGECLRLDAAIERFDDALRLAADRVEERRPVVVEAANLFARHVLAVRLPALRQA